MRLLLDTHVVLWWLTDDRHLSATHRFLIADPRNTVLVSSVSSAEVAIKASQGRLDVPGPLSMMTDGQGFDELPFTSAHADELHTLPWHHPDPFDRMLICQARVEGAVFLTADAACRQYDVKVR